MARLVLLGLALLPAVAALAQDPPAWDTIRKVEMRGGLRLFWDVGGGDRVFNVAQAKEHGFEPVDLLNTYSDYPGGQKENINTFLKDNRTNPWRKPDFFERIIRRNIADKGHQGAIFVHDIEFGYEEDLDKAWADEAARTASGATTREAFAEAYWREWASWYSLPCRWSKEAAPKQPVGIYGPQPFRRDYWGVAGKTAQQIDGTHRTDAELYRHIAPFVDFVVASVYIFYDDPGSVYYLAANLEENAARAKTLGATTLSAKALSDQTATTLSAKALADEALSAKTLGDKPVYAYEWLRYHDSNQRLRGQELAPWLVEAMAVVPYFCGARGVVLWGWEPKGKGQYYQRLPRFVDSLGRVADLSERLATATPEPCEPAHVVWREKRPLVRALRLAPGEWAVLATAPYQPLDSDHQTSVTLGGQDYALPLHGRDTEIFLCRDGRATKVAMPRG